jgi:hypothetical protein
MSIEFLEHDQIDKSQWDKSLINSVNGNIYAWSWYLDAVCPGWCALVTKDYQSMMPLTGRKKMGFDYLFRPLLNQQLGIFSVIKPDEDLIKNFLSSIPARYKLIEISLNRGNKEIPKDFEFSQHACFELDLNSDYISLRAEFNQNTRRSLQKAKKADLSLDENVSAEEFMKLLEQDQSEGSVILSRQENLILLHNLLKAMKNNNSGRIMGSRNRDGKLIAAVLFGKSFQTWYYLAPVNSEEGREIGALSQIIEALIQENAGLAVRLDFEGSDIPGVARFYAGFGAKPYTYQSIRKNSLPWPLKYLKS